MQPAPIHHNEAQRLKVVKNLKILDTEPEKRFDVITKKLADELKAPMAALSIIDKDREWYKSSQGLEQKQGARDTSFCGHAMYSSHVFTVEDTLKDPRFADNPQVVNPPHIRFYAGISLHDDKTKLPIGTLCVKDVKPRTLSLDELALLIELGKEAEQEINKTINQ